MLNLFTTATVSWFDDGCCDVKYLDMWHSVPLSYEPGQVIDNSWHHDCHEVVIGRDVDGDLFPKAADHLMRYHFYPPHIMTHVSHSSLANRWLQVKDRIVQRIHLLFTPKIPILNVISMTEIVAVIDEPTCKGFTYATVATHAEQGEWSISVRKQANADILLTMKAISRPVPTEPRRNHRFMRAFQKQAHQQGLQYFQQLI